MDSAQQPPNDPPENPQAGGSSPEPPSPYSAPEPQQHPQYPPPQQYPPVQQYSPAQQFPQSQAWQARYLVPGEIEIAGQRWVPAGFGWRLLAYLVDFVVLFILSQILIVAAGIPQADPERAMSAIMQIFAGSFNPKLLEDLGPPWYQAWLTYIMYGSYFTLFHHFSGATLGKQALGLQVRTTEGRRLSLLHSFLRYMGYFFTAWLAYTAWWMGFDARRRTLYDVLLGTNVFKSAGPAPIVYQQPH